MSFPFVSRLRGLAARRTRDLNELSRTACIVIVTFSTKLQVCQQDCAAQRRCRFFPRIAD
ncbi:unnamed protein product [Trichogramma brassicae]|uniref:Uncharacterized protein n=1 Tax=Trichogramma brassicae TaxID=86971 RepID=A0A6H5IG02_9HYME|nr:unnamed protein product [Trichogramma brassicae]